MKNVHRCILAKINHKKELKHTENIFSVTAFLNDFLSPLAISVFICMKGKQILALS